MYLPNLSGETPVTEGSCDNCGNYDKLILYHGGWYCPKCYADQQPASVRAAAYTDAIPRGSPLQNARYS